MQKPMIARRPSRAPSFVSMSRASPTSRIAKALSDANKRYTLAVLPDAPHAFATFDRESYHPGAAEAAWRMTFGFFVDTLMQGSAAAYG